MKKLSKKSVLLCASVMAMCAFAMPAMASAASWSGTLGTHVFDSSNPNNRLAFSVPAISAGATCPIAQLHGDVRNSSDAVITGVAFQNCMGTGNAVNCTLTFTATSLPWTVTNPTTNNVTIDGIHFDKLFENTPGNATACAIPGQITLTGSLNSGVWSNPAHEITFTNATGLVAHVNGIGSLPVSTTGTLRDTAQTLTMVD